MTLNNNIFPKSGFVFIDADKVRHVADSWPGVIKRVQAYRKRLGVPVGDVGAEVVAQACAREPVLCQRGGEQHVRAVKRASLKSRIISWLNAVRANQDKSFVDDALAKQRAGVCAKCPKNVPLPGGCATCTNLLNELRRAILGPGRFIDGRLNECEVMAEDIPVTVHVDMTTVDNPELPGHCWRRRSL